MSLSSRYFILEKGVSHVDTKEMLYKLVGAKVRYYRTLSGLSQKELAKRVHLSESAISRIERGDYNQSISLATLVDISTGLKIDIQLLLSITEAEKHLMNWQC